MHVKFLFCCWASIAIVTTSNPCSVGKPETFQSLSLTTWLDYHLFNSTSAIFCLVKLPSGALKSQRTPGTPSLREGFEGCGEGEQQEGEWVWVLHVSDTEHVPAYMTDTHKQIDWFCGEMSVAVCCLTFWWQTAHKQMEAEVQWKKKQKKKQVNHPLIHKHEELHVVTQQRQTCCKGKGHR